VKLSQDRAATVVAALKAQSIDGARIFPPRLEIVTDWLSFALGLGSPEK